MPRLNAPKDRNLDFSRSPAVYFRKKVDGASGPVLIFQSLGRIDLETARKVRDALEQTLEGAEICAKMGLPIPENELATKFGVQGMLDRLGLVRKKQPLATIGEVIAAFEADCPGRNIATGTGSSAYKAGSALKMILREVKKLETSEDAEKLPASVLTPELLQDFQSLRTAAAVANGPAAVQTARVTAASTINQARMVVAAPAMQEANMRALRLPDLEAFRAWKPAATTRKLRVPVDDVTLERLRARMDDLWLAADGGDEAARGRWLAAALAGNLGLRRGECVAARWDWVRVIAGRPRVYIVTDGDFAPKGNERSVEIEATVWADMQALRIDGSVYMVPGATAEARDEVLTANAAWLREISPALHVDKPNHELRAVFLQAMDRAHGRAAAQEAAGHDKARTTEIYTGRGGSRKSVRAL